MSCRVPGDVFERSTCHRCDRPRFGRGYFILVDKSDNPQPLAPPQKLVSAGLNPRIRFTLLDTKAAMFLVPADGWPKPWINRWPLQIQGGRHLCAWCASTEITERYSSEIAVFGQENADDYFQKRFSRLVGPWLTKSLRDIVSARIALQTSQELSQFERYAHAKSLDDQAVGILERALEICSEKREHALPGLRAFWRIPKEPHEIDTALQIQERLESSLFADDEEFSSVFKEATLQLYDLLQSQGIMENTERQVARALMHFWELRQYLLSNHEQGSTKSPQDLEEQLFEVVKWHIRKRRKDSAQG